MLILNEKDMRRAVTLPQVMDKVEDAYRIFASGAFYMPERPVVMHGKETLLYMPCFMEGCFGTKFLTLFPDNPAKGMPYIDGLMLLNNAETGKTEAILDGSFLTALRTGAVGGVGMRCFTPMQSRSVGVIGCGKQGFHQLLYACEARPIEEIYLFDALPKDFDSFIAQLRAELGEKQPRIHVCANVEELLSGSEIIVTTTPATAPVVPDDAALLRGKSFICIGSYKPQMRELPNAIWELVDVVYTELPFAMEESGDLSQPLADGLLDESRVRYIGNLLSAERRPTPPAPGSTNYFKSVGMGLLDLNVAQLIYQEALKQGLGQRVEL